MVLHEKQIPNCSRHDAQQMLQCRNHQTVYDVLICVYLQHDLQQELSVAQTERIAQNTLIDRLKADNVRLKQQLADAHHRMIQVKYIYILVLVSSHKGIY